MCTENLNPNVAVMKPTEKRGGEYFGKGHIDVVVDYVTIDICDCDFGKELYQTSRLGTRK